MEQKYPTYQNEQKPNKEKTDFDTKYVQKERELIGCKYGRLKRDYKDFKQKHRGDTLGSLISYDFGPKFKATELSTKPGRISMNTLKETINLKDGAHFYGKRPTEITRHEYPNLREL